MRIIRNLFKWRKVKDKYGAQVNIGYAMDGNLKTLADINYLASGRCYHRTSQSTMLPQAIFSPGCPAAASLLACAPIC